MKKGRFLSILCAIAIMVVSIMSVEAVETKAATSGGQNTKTITVVTKGNWLIPGSESITLKNTKCKISYSKYGLTFKKKTYTKSIYPYYDITVKSADGDVIMRTSMSGSSKKIKLDPDKKYYITVSYNSMMSTLGYMDFKWIDNPHWSVGSTYKVSSYY